MKKTLITLMALVGMAGAAEYNNLLSSSDGWTSYHWYSNTSTEKEKGTYINTEEEKFVGSGGWDYTSIKYTFDDVITLDSVNNTLEFSYTLYVGDNACSTVTFIGSDKAIVTGVGGYSDQKGVGFGTTATTTGKFYNFKDETNGGHTVKTDSWTKVYNYSTLPLTADVTGCVTFDGSEYTLTLSCGESTNTLSLGKSFDVQSLVISGNGSGGANVSNLKLAVVPEPATATLSLLALAGLAARRRRK